MSTSEEYEKLIYKARYHMNMLVILSVLSAMGIFLIWGMVVYTSPKFQIVIYENSSSAVVARKISDQVLVAESIFNSLDRPKLSEKESEKWSKDAYLISDEFTAVEAFKIVSVLCDIFWYAQHGEYSYELSEKQRLDQKSSQYLTDILGYKFDETGTIIGW